MSNGIQPKTGVSQHSIGGGAVRRNELDLDFLLGALCMEIQKKNGVTIITMDDRCDATEAQKLKDMVRNIAEETKIKLIIDLAKMRFIDSSGCGALVASLRVVMKNNGDMKIANPSAHARTLFHLTRLNKVFEIHDNVEAAFNSFSQDVSAPE